MYVNIYVCIYVNVYVSFTYSHIYIHIHIFTFTCAIHLYIHMQVHMHIRMHILMTYIYTYTYIHIYTYIHRCIWIYIYFCIYTIFIFMHIHMPVNVKIQKRCFSPDSCSLKKHHRFWEPGWGQLLRGGGTSCMATQTFRSRPDLVHAFGSAEAGDVYFTEEEIVGWTGTQAQIGSGANSSDNWFLTETSALCSHIMEKSLIRFGQRNPEV